MVKKYITPKSVPFLEIMPCVFTSGLLVSDHCYVRIYRNIPYNDSLNTPHDIMYYVPNGIPFIT
jgi:hypothetical protein